MASRKRGLGQGRRHSSRSVLAAVALRRANASLASCRQSWRTT